MFRRICFSGASIAFVSTAGLVVFTRYRSVFCQHKMSTFDRAKNEAERVVQEMRNSADKMRQNVESSFRQGTDHGAYSYATLTQRLRLGQLVALPLQVLSLYMEADRVGLASFILPFSFICANLYLVFTRWQKSADGRADVQSLINSRNAQAKVHAAIQVLGPFLLALLVHAIAPYFPTSLSSFMFNLSSYLLIAAAFGVLFLDCFESIKNKIH